MAILVYFKIREYNLWLPVLIIFFIIIFILLLRIRIKLDVKITHWGLTYISVILYIGLYLGVLFYLRIKRVTENDLDLKIIYEQVMRKLQILKNLLSIYTSNDNVFNSFNFNLGVYFW